MLSSSWVVEASWGGRAELCGANNRDTTPEGWLFLKLCDVYDVCFEDESESESSAESWFVFKEICDH